VWWFISIIPALRRLRQEDLEFGASLGYKNDPASKYHLKINFIEIQFMYKNCILSWDLNTFERDIPAQSPQQSRCRIFQSSPNDTEYFKHLQMIQSNLSPNSILSAYVQVHFSQINIHFSVTVYLRDVSVNSLAPL
jgi:hypothetical protein